MTEPMAIPTFQNIITLLYAGPAIIHADMFYGKELVAGNIKEANYQMYSILLNIGLIDEGGKLTDTGNEVFACIDLIRYFLITGNEMAINKLPKKEQWQYDLLRKGLGQFAYVRGIEYVDFIDSSIKTPVDVVLDVGGGNGTYLEMVGERYKIEQGVLIDKDVWSAVTLFEDKHPNSKRYSLLERDITEGFDLSIEFDLILVNEILHLNNSNWWDHIITEVLLHLKPGGHVCFGEVQPDAAFDWRMYSYTEEGRSLSLAEFMSFLQSIYSKNFEEEIHIQESDTHWYVILTKKGENNA